MKQECEGALTGNCLAQKMAPNMDFIRFAVALSKV